MKIKRITNILYKILLRSCCTLIRLGELVIKKRLGKLKYLFFILFNLTSVLVLSQEYLPISKGEVIKHTYYTLSYLEKYEQAEWVYYILTPQMLQGNTKRDDSFKSDSFVSTGSSQLIDFKNSGYDRGHLAPAGDMKINKLAMRESFFMSNISPQHPSFNRGIWRSLETLVRNWASKNKLYIVTGGVLTKGLSEIGVNHVDVPNYFYKIVYNPIENKMIAFVLPNKKGEKSLKEYVVSVDMIEKLTNIDFFSQLPDQKENQLEANTNLNDWNFVYSNTRKKSKSKSTLTTQCKGIAKSTGVRCKNKTTNSNGFCHYHQNQQAIKSNNLNIYTGSQCMAKTKKGIRCKRKVSDGVKYCWQHQ